MDNNDSGIDNIDSTRMDHDDPDMDNIDYTRMSDNDSNVYGIDSTRLFRAIGQVISYYTETLARTPWSKVFNGPCGRFLILCFFLSLVLLVAMIAYVGIYMSSVLNDPNIMCMPFFIFAWKFVLPYVLTLWFLTTFSLIWVNYGTKQSHMNCRMLVYLSTHFSVFFCFFFFLLGATSFSLFNRRDMFPVLMILLLSGVAIGFIWVEIGLRYHEDCRVFPYLCSSVSYCVMFLFLVIFTSVFAEHGVIIKGNNSSDIMFQYIGSRSDPKAYPLFFRLDGINNIFPNSSCDFVRFYDLCPAFGLLQDINFPGAFRCQPNSKDGLEFLLPYLESLMGFSRHVNDIGITFAIFFALAYVFMMERRLLSSEEWVENRLFQSSFGKLNERTPLI